MSRTVLAGHGRIFGCCASGAANWINGRGAKIRIVKLASLTKAHGPTLAPCNTTIARFTYSNFKIFHGWSMGIAREAIYNSTVLIWFDMKYSNLPNIWTYWENTFIIFQVQSKNLFKILTNNWKYINESPLYIVKINSFDTQVSLPLNRTHSYAKWGIKSTSACRSHSRFGKFSIYRHLNPPLALILRLFNTTFRRTAHSVYRSFIIPGLCLPVLCTYRNLCSFHTLPRPRSGA